MTEYIITSKHHKLCGRLCTIVDRAEDNPEWVTVMMLEARDQSERLPNLVLLRQRILTEVNGGRHE